MQDNESPTLTDIQQEQQSHEEEKGTDPNNVLTKRTDASTHNKTKSFDNNKPNTRTQSMGVLQNLDDNELNIENLRQFNANIQSNDNESIQALHGSVYSKENVNIEQDTLDHTLDIEEINDNNNENLIVMEDKMKTLLNDEPIDNEFNYNIEADDNNENVSAKLDSATVNDGFEQLQCIDSQTKSLVHGYLKEQKHKLFPNDHINNAYFNLHTMFTVILKYCVGLITVQIKSALLHNHFSIFNWSLYPHSTIKDLLHVATQQMKLLYPSNVNDYVIFHGGIQLEGKRTLKQCGINYSVTFSLRERPKYSNMRICNNNDNNNVQRIISVKVGILGDKKCGKTALLMKHIENKFDEEYIPTVGVNLMKKSFELKNCIANLQIYDHGHHKYMLKNVTKDAKAVIFVFDLVDKSSLYSIKKLYKEARKLNKLFKTIFVGTKYDLFEEMNDGYKSEVIELSRKYAHKMHSPLIMCSSKTNIHIKQMYTVVIGSVFKIKIKSKQKHQGPILEYDVIYSK